MASIFSGALQGFAGTVDGSFYKAPKWVDTSKPPGATSLTKIVGAPGWWTAYPTLKYFFFSPTLVWFLVTVAMYFLFPYKYDDPDVLALSGSFIAYRVAIHVTLMNLYSGWWHITLYMFKWGKRKFKEDIEGPTLSRMFHNLWYSNLGAVQSGVWEAAFIHLYATGKLGYVPDSEAFSMTSEGLKTFGWILLVPLWRDMHFYNAHRFIHFRCIYKYVHSLHHRNSDIEPFAGLTMHPIEHLFYFGCVGVTMYVHASPIIMLWNLVHLLISPAASHSGWEDSYQSDQYHYLHHSKFECNYGTSGLPFDSAFGTFRDKAQNSSTYKGEWKEQKDAPKETEKRTKYLSGGLTLRGAIWGSIDQAIYDIVCCIGLPALLVQAWRMRDNWTVDVPLPVFVGATVALLPIVCGFVLCQFFDHQSWRWPFHKDRVLGSLGIHIVMAVLFVVLPVYHTVAAVFGDSVYCALYSC